MAHSYRSSDCASARSRVWNPVHAILTEASLFLPLVPLRIIVILRNRWLVNKGRDDEALQVLSKARRLPPDSDLVQIEFL